MFETLIADVEDRRKSFTVYAQDEETDVEEQLATRNVTVERRRLPPCDPNSFVIIRDDDDFAGAVTLEEFQELLSPPIVHPWNRTGLSAGYRALFDLLGETLFTSLDSRQLLAASREIEDRAWRVGRGTLHVGFQSLSTFETQAETYRHLAEATELQIHVYGEPDWDPPAIAGVTFHGASGPDVSQFWSLAFDGGGTSDQACALVARERTDGEYFGFWTYDPDVVADVVTGLTSARD